MEARRYFPCRPGAKNWINAWRRAADMNFRLFSKTEAQALTVSDFVADTDDYEESGNPHRSVRPRRIEYGVYEVTIRKLTKEEVWGK